ncbi:MAG: beta-galactosidase [bacterium]|nr:beta-galactosidase [bacterium]
MRKSLEIIQQCQFLGQPHPELLKDEFLKECKKSGITSLQSYVTWAEIEKEKDKFDFSSYDVLVEKLEKHGLKWVPFLIMGPEYATPEWFKKSEESVFYQCLEHQKESKIQSLWNPNLSGYVERFLKTVAMHYRNHSIFECVTLGISGNWGEAIFPADGGFNKNFHTHPGWWAADKYAQKSYIDFLSEKYGSLASLNEVWNTDFNDFQEIELPSFITSKRKDFLNFCVNIASQSPNFIKVFLKLLRRIFLRLSKRTFSLVSQSSSRPQEAESRRWLDFSEWYLDSMTKWSDFWLKTARRYFPESKIYLTTGGTAEPVSGVDFARQTKVASQYGAGIRITNQTNDYAESFILTRLVASAVKLYGNYFVTEEAGVLQTGSGVAMRIFDALSTGAEGIYCKNFFSTGNDDPCLKKIIPAGQKTEGADVLLNNMRYWQEENPIVKAAVFFPNTAVALDSDIIISLYNQCALLRDLFDFDLIDENMIKDGGLKNYQFLLILSGEMPEGNISAKVQEWTAGGGKAFSSLREKELDLIQNAIGRIDGKKDGVYATLFPGKVVYYNSNNTKVKKEVELLNKTIEIGPNSILIFNI